MAARLDAIAVDAWSARCSEASFAGLFAAVIVDVFEVEGVDVAWDISRGLIVSYLYPRSLPSAEVVEEEGSERLECRASRLTQEPSSRY